MQSSATYVKGATDQFMHCPLELGCVQLVDTSNDDYLKLHIIYGSEYYLICARKPDIWDNFHVCFYFTLSLNLF